MDSGGGKTVGKGLKTVEEDKDRREEGVGRKKKKKKKDGRENGNHCPGPLSNG